MVIEFYECCDGTCMEMSPSPWTGIFSPKHKTFASATRSTGMWPCTPITWMFRSLSCATVIIKPFGYMLSNLLAICLIVGQPCAVGFRLGILSIKIKSTCPQHGIFYLANYFAFAFAAVALALPLAFAFGAPGSRFAFGCLGTNFLATNIPTHTTYEWCKSMHAQQKLSHMILFIQS